MEIDTHMDGVLFSRRRGLVDVPELSLIEDWFESSFLIHTR